MKNTISIKAYCKINLSLDIKGLRCDGKHEVDMVMQTIPLYDIIEIKKLETKEKSIKLTSDAKWMAVDSKNTAYKAALLLSNDFEKINCGTEIYIKKQIPGCGGLGGSSADAAGVLLGMNELYDLGLSCEELQNYGSMIGADVPFLIKYGAAIATGTGTDLHYTEPLREGILLLVNSGTEISTAEAYKLYDKLESEARVPFEAHQKATETAAAMASGLKALEGKTKNVLEYPAFYIEPGLKEIKEELFKAGAKVAMMSGSGGTVFGIFEEQDAIKAAEAKAVFDSRGWFTFLCDFNKFDIRS